MSRASLQHQEKNVNRRAREAEEAWEQAVEEGRNNRARNLVPQKDDTFKMEPMLMSNIQKDPYFVKICREIADVTALIDQIYYDVEEKEQSIQPWAIGELLFGVAAVNSLLISYEQDLTTFSLFPPAQIIIR